MPDGLEARLANQALAYLGPVLSAEIVAKHHSGAIEHAGDDKAAYSPRREGVGELYDLWSYTFQALDRGEFDWCHAEAAFVRIAELLAIYTGERPPVLDVVGLAV